MRVRADSSWHDHRTELDRNELWGEGLPRVVVALDGRPLENTAAAPSIENDAGLKRLAVRCDNDAVMLTQGGSAGAGQVEIEGLRMQDMQCGKKGLTPVVAQPMLTQAGVYEQIVDPWKRHRMPFTTELCRPLDGGDGEAFGFLR
jgi:hypothetical protein